MTFKLKNVYSLCMDTKNNKVKTQNYVLSFSEVLRPWKKVVAILFKRLFA